MHYYINDGLTIGKYEVQCDYNKIKEIRKSIIECCSRIIKFEGESSFSPIEVKDNDYIRNYKCSIIKEWQNKYGENHQLYMVSFDYYIHPYLITLIDELLNNNISVINKIINYDKKQLDIIDIYHIENNYLANNIFKNISFYLIEGFYLSKIKAKLQNDLNNNSLKGMINNDIYFFIKEILDCISYTKVGELDIIQYNEFIDFFNLDSKCVNFLNDFPNRNKRKKRGLLDL